MRRNLSPFARMKHEEFLSEFFRKDVWIVTEWRDGAVYKTEKIGQIACSPKPAQWPFRPGSGARV